MLVKSQVAPGKPEILHCFDLSEEERSRRYGRGGHSPIDELTVSQPTTLMFEFAIGKDEVVTGGRLMIVWRWPFDWGDLQSDQPTADGYLRTEFIPGDAADSGQKIELSSRYQWIAGIEPWHHVLAIQVAEGSLRQGDRVRIVCGDTSSGGAGWRAPTCAVRRCGFLMLIDHQGNGRRIRLIDPPQFRVQPDIAVRLVAFAPSDVVTSEPFEVTVRAEDCWGNPTSVSEQSSLRLDPQGSDTPPPVTIERLDTSTFDPPIEKLEVVVPERGSVRLRATNGDKLTALTNSIRVHDQMPAMQLFWGDLHSGQTEIGCGAGSLAEHYAFGRDCAGLQFTTHQANDHYVTLDEWNHTREVTDNFYKAGQYVPFLGCEWSALTKDGGDRNVFYLDDEPRLRRSDRFFEESEPDPEPDVRTGPEFVEAFSELNVLVNIHVGGRMTNLQWHAPQIEKLCEIHSTHGTSEWFVYDALSRGYQVGITAGTDGVMGRPGACHPGRRLIRNLRNGLTAVYAAELTRASLWEAFQQRRCYATTGERIRLWFEVDGAVMGSETRSDGHPNISCQVEGTAPLERIDVLRGAEVVHSWQIAEHAMADNGALLRILWGGTERKGTARLQRVHWDGSLRITDGELYLLETVNVQSFADHVEAVGVDAIRWSNATAGNATGIVIHVQGDERTRLKFESEPASFDITLDEVRDTETVKDASGVGRFVKIGPAPRNDGPRRFETNWIDESPIAGVTPYWIRVVQIDQAMAWSSPVYVSR
jgi:hypothetical protein